MLVPIGEESFLHMYFCAMNYFGGEILCFCLHLATQLVHHSNMECIVYIWMSVPLILLTLKEKQQRGGAHSYVYKSFVNLDIIFQYKSLVHSTLLQSTELHQCHCYRHSFPLIETYPEMTLPKASSSVNMPMPWFRALWITSGYA